jgi:hypothetical protein
MVRRFLASTMRVRNFLLLLDIFTSMEKNYAGLFWQAIILALMVIALIALVD